jgi:hypothetical protein
MDFDWGDSQIEVAIIVYTHYLFCYFCVLNSSRILSYSSRNEKAVTVLAKLARMSCTYYQQYEFCHWATPEVSERIQRKY